MGLALLAAGLRRRGRGGGGGWAHLHYRIVRPLIHFIPDSQTYSVPPFLIRKYDGTLGGGLSRGLRGHTGHPPVGVAGGLAVADAADRLADTQ